MSLSPEAIATLSRVTTATITTVLLKKGLRNVWLRGSKPTYRTALARLAEISSIAARSASLTISPPSRWAFAPLCASVRMTPAEKLRQQTLSSANRDQDKQE